MKPPEFLPKDLRARLVANGAQGREFDHVPVVKIIDPLGPGTWLLDLTAFFVPVELRELTHTGGAEDDETWIRRGADCFQVKADRGADGSGQACGIGVQGRWGIAIKLLSYQASGRLGWQNSGKGFKPNDGVGVRLKSPWGRHYINDLPYTAVTSVPVVSRRRCRAGWGS